MSMVVISRYFAQQEQVNDTHYEQLARKLGVPPAKARRLVREVWSRPRLQVLDPTDVIAEISSGRRLHSIAIEYHVDPIEMRSWLRQHATELKQAEADAAEAQMEAAEVALEHTTDKIELGVNGERLNHARWKAERLAKEKYRPTGPVVPQVQALQMTMILGPGQPPTQGVTIDQESVLTQNTALQLEPQEIRARSDNSPQLDFPENAAAAPDNPRF